MVTRSYARINAADLQRLADIANRDREDFFRRKPNTGRLYESRLFAIALCQGAALHYVDKKNGVKDFDVWSFFREHPKRRFPPRRRAIDDFGTPKFGTSVDSPNFIGRRVDLIGRSISARNFSNPVTVLREYLRAGRTVTAKLLSLKAVVLIAPLELLGTVVWYGPSDRGV
jgi:hypothetical protein